MGPHFGMHTTIRHINSQMVSHIFNSLYEGRRSYNEMIDFGLHIFCIHTVYKFAQRSGSLAARYSRPLYLSMRI